MDSATEALERVCIICLDSNPPPIQSGCACRSDSGLAHVACLIEKAVSQQQQHRGGKAWWECQTCGQRFTGTMQTELGEALWSRVCDQAEDSGERLAAAGILAACRLTQGKYVEAERIEREVLRVQRRMFGEEHLETLNTAARVALSIMHQAHKSRSTGKFADAERINREVLGAYRRILGNEHPTTLTSAINLALSLSGQGKHCEAEPIHRDVLGATRRVFGEEHLETQTAASSLALSLSEQGKYADAERIYREVLAIRRRVLGENHPETMKSAYNLALSLSFQGKNAEAEDRFQAALEAYRRVLGSAHPDTLQCAYELEYVRSQMRAKPPAKTGGNVGATTARAAPHRLPAGTRVLVQRLVAKPEHNGRRARVLSFDGRTGRYAVVLDDGKELSLKPECVARAGCAAAGCASEEASSQCSRCQAVRYCSRECQRADWRAHKRVCAAVLPAAP
jgi:tetratricopeptide (TPR) repeat protein